MTHLGGGLAPPWIHCLINSFVRSFIRSFVRWFVGSLVRSFIHSFIHSFIAGWLVGWLVTLSLTSSLLLYLFLLQNLTMIRVPEAKSCFLKDSIANAPRPADLQKLVRAAYSSHTVTTIFKLK